MNRLHINGWVSLLEFMSTQLNSESFSLPLTIKWHEKKNPKAIIYFIFLYPECSITTWTTRGRRAQLSSMQLTSFRESVWTMVTRCAQTTQILCVVLFFFNDFWLFTQVLFLYQSHKVSVVREEQLEGVSFHPCFRNLVDKNVQLLFYLFVCLFVFAEFKSKMSLIVSVHVYSVQKALLRDSGPLYAVDYDAVKDNLLSCSK